MLPALFIETPLAQPQIADPRTPPAAPGESFHTVLMGLRLSHGVTVPVAPKGQQPTAKGETAPVPDEIPMESTAAVAAQGDSHPAEPLETGANDPPLLPGMEDEGADVWLGGPDQGLVILASLPPVTTAESARVIPPDAATDPQAPLPVAGQSAPVDATSAPVLAAPPTVAKVDPRKGPVPSLQQSLVEARWLGSPVSRGATEAPQWPIRSDAPPVAPPAMPETDAVPLPIAAQTPLDTRAPGLMAAMVASPVALPVTAAAAPVARSVASDGVAPVRAAPQGPAAPAHLPVAPAAVASPEPGAAPPNRDVALAVSVRPATPAAFAPLPTPAQPAPALPIREAASQPAPAPMLPAMAANTSAARPESPKAAAAVVQPTVTPQPPTPAPNAPAPRAAALPWTPAPRERETPTAIAPREAMTPLTPAPQGPLREATVSPSVHPFVRSAPELPGRDAPIPARIAPSAPQSVQPLAPAIAPVGQPIAAPRQPSPPQIATALPAPSFAPRGQPDRVMQPTPVAWVEAPATPLRAKALSGPLEPLPPAQSRPAVETPTASPPPAPVARAVPAATAEPRTRDIAADLPRPLAPTDEHAPIASAPAEPLAPDDVPRDVARFDPPRAAPAHVEPLRADPMRHETAQQIARQIAERLPPANSPGFDLALDPQELGHVRLKLVTVDGSSLLTIHAERPETLDLMRRHIGTLEQDLRAQGHESLTLRFSGGSNAGTGQWSAGQDQQGQPPRAPASDSPPGAALHGSDTPGTPAPRSAALGALDHLDLRL